MTTTPDEPMTRKPTLWQWILTSEEAQIVHTALGIWSSEDNDAPHGEIANLRERLERMGAARR